MFFASPRQNHNFNFLLKGIAKPKEIKKKKKTAEGKFVKRTKVEEREENRDPVTVFTFNKYFLFFD